jgi:hypothetical protein
MRPKSTWTIVGVLAILMLVLVTEVLSDPGPGSVITMVVMASVVGAAVVIAMLSKRQQSGQQGGAAGRRLASRRTILLLTLGIALAATIVPIIVLLAVAPVQEAVSPPSTLPPADQPTMRVASPLEGFGLPLAAAAIGVVALGVMWAMMRVRGRQPSGQAPDQQPRAAAPEDSPKRVDRVNWAEMLRPDEGEDEDDVKVDWWVEKLDKDDQPEP